MIIIFDNDVTIYMPTLTAYGAIWDWLSTRMVVSIRIRQPVIHDLGKMKSSPYNLGTMQDEYTLGKVK